MQPSRGMLAIAKLLV